MTCSPLRRLAGLVALARRRPSSPTLPLVDNWEIEWRRRALENDGSHNLELLLDMWTEFGRRMRA